MGDLNTFVNMVVAEVRKGRVTVGMLTARLIREGMESEELTLLLEIVALEVNLTPPPTFTAMRAVRAYKATSVRKLPHLVDVVG